MLRSHLARTPMDDTSPRSKRLVYSTLLCRMSKESSPPRRLSWQSAWPSNFLATRSYSAPSLTFRGHAWIYLRAFTLCGSCVETGRGENAL